MFSFGIVPQYRGASVEEIKRMERHFLRVVDERRNLGNSNENLLVCSDYTLVGKPLPLIESFMSRKANEFFKNFPRVLHIRVKRTDWGNKLVEYSSAE